MSVTPLCVSLQTAMPSCFITFKCLWNYLYSVMAQSLFPLLHQLAMLFVQSVLGAKRAHLVRAKDRDTTSSSMLHSPHHIFRLSLHLLLYASNSRMYIFCVCMMKCSWVSACAYKPMSVAQRQIQADSISKKLQYCILNSNYSDVYSNQCHNRWRGMNLWQAGRSFSSWSCGFWCLMTASREELTHLSVAHIKKFLSAAERERELNVRNKLALMHTPILLMYNLCLRACIYAQNRTL